MLSEHTFISSPYVVLDARAPFSLLCGLVLYRTNINALHPFAAARNADDPNLQPLPDLIARSSAGSTIEVETEALAARVARLKARANALKGRTIIDGATRLRLLNAVKDRPA